MGCDTIKRTKREKGQSLQPKVCNDEKLAKDKWSPAKKFGGTKRAQTRF